MINKKELTKEYKNKKFRCGVFKLINSVTGKVFVGSSPNLDVKYNSIKFQLEAGMFPIAELQSDWNTFGEAAFSYRIVEIIDTKDDETALSIKELKEYEQITISQMRESNIPLYNSYNPSGNRLKQ